MSSETIFFESCSHENIENGTCTICGLSANNSLEVEDSDYSRQHQRPKILILSALEKDINNMDLDQEVLEWILNRISNTSKNMYKETMRHNIIFGLVYMAHLNLSKEFDPDAFSKRMNMTKSDIELSLGLVSGINPRITPCNQEGISIPLAVVSPASVTPGLCEELKIAPCYITIIQELTRLCVKVDKSLLEENPRKVSAGAIKYYCDFHKIKFSATNTNPKIISADIKKYKDWIEKSYKKYLCQNVLSI